MRCVTAQFDPVQKKYVACGLSRNLPVTERWTDVEIVFKTYELRSADPMRLHLSIGALKGRFEMRDVSLAGPLKDATAPRRGGTLTLGKQADAEGEAEGEKAPDGRRTWTDARGRKLTGTLTSVADGVVHIKTEGGKVMKVPLNKLSKADQEFVEEQ
jgi:hypothetical protein